MIREENAVGIHGISGMTIFFVFRFRFRHGERHFAAASEKVVVPCVLSPTLDHFALSSDAWEGLRSRKNKHAENKL